METTPGQIYLIIKARLGRIRLARGATGSCPSRKGYSESLREQAAMPWRSDKKKEKRHVR
jgi:hypothetical protein